MIYPDPLGPGSKIAITAFSAGIKAQYERRFAEIIRTLKGNGYDVILGNCLKGSRNAVSAPKEARAAELQKFLTDDSIDAIAPPWGGEVAIELLPLLDFAAISQSKPKWVFGFSDVSTITSVLNDRLGWATVHCSNLMDLIDTSVDPLTSNTLSYLETVTSGMFEQFSSEKFTRKWPPMDVDPCASFIGDQPTQWKWLVAPSNGDSMKGRLIGGCWDTQYHLFETPYLSLKRLKERYDEGLLLFLENVEMSPYDLVRVIHNMAFRGVFDVIDGLILGRNCRLDSGSDDELTYMDVLEQHLTNKGIPVLYDVDIGHVPPNLTLINGAVAQIGISDEKGFIRQWLTL